MALPKHSEITDSNEIHVPKGFSEALPNSAPSKNKNGELEWRDIDNWGARANFNATIDPTPADDVNRGYSPGSRWLNLTSHNYFICVSATANAAIWREVTNTPSEIHIPRIDNPHQVTKAQVGLGNVQNVKVNLHAPTDPTISDDLSQGYSEGSLWVNASTRAAYICVDPTSGAALWAPLTVDPGQLIGIDHRSLSHMDSDDHPQYLHRDGSRPMQGDLDLGAHAIKNLVDASEPADAVTKSQLDTEAQARQQADSVLQNSLASEASARAAEDLTLLKLDGSRPMSGDLDAGGNKLIEVASGSSATDAVNKGQLDSESSARSAADSLLQTNINTEAIARAAEDLSFLKRDGSRSLTGDLDLASHKIKNVSSGSLPNDAVNKGQLDSEASARSGADATLQANINSETATRVSDGLTYVKTDGTRPMAADLDLGGHNIVNSGNLNGISLANHGSRHLPGGADALLAGTPVSTGTANSPGTVNSFVRSDHVHNTVLANQNVTSQTTINNFTNASDTQILSTTPAVGTYLVLFNFNITVNSNHDTATGNIYSGGAKVSDSERARGSGEESSIPLILSGQTIITVNGSQLVELRCRVTASSTIGNRSLTLIRIG